MKRILAAVAALATLAAPASAKVTAQSANGFSVTQEADLTVPPQGAYDAFVSIGSWWDMAHSYSHDPSKLHITTGAGGTWYEDLPDNGRVTHMVLMQSAPGDRLVFTGGMGPLAFMGVAGTLVVNFSKSPTGTHVKLTYSIGGFDPDGFKGLSKAVDGVWMSQLSRYQAFANTGKTPG